jgi:uncharacterized repeat protein (TIGR01451 family)
MRHRTQGLGRALVGGAAALSLAVLGAVPVTAQTPTPTVSPTYPPVTALTVTTVFPSITVDPGGQATFPLTVLTPQPERVDLSIGSQPDGFKSDIRGNGSIVGSVYTGAIPTPELEVRVTVPEDAKPGDYQVVVAAKGGSETASLPLDLVVADTSAGSVSMTTDFPALRGDSSKTFQFNLRLSNDTSQELTFALAGVAPDGWTVDVVPSGQQQAANAVVAAGAKQSISVTVTPAPLADAGQYPITVTADAGTKKAETPLMVEITGSYSMTLTAPDGRLNTTATAGNATTFAVVVTNTGTAPLDALTLSGTAPTGWKVEFQPDTLDSVPSGQQATANAIITPTGNAVAGDYVVTRSAKNDQVNQSMQVRTTVETSSVFGYVAIGLIVLVLIGLFLVFRRYGRR